MFKKNLYDVLELDETCNESSILFQYMQKQHELNFAKDILSCPLKRKLYNDTIKSKKQKDKTKYPMPMSNDDMFKNISNIDKNKSLSDIDNIYSGFVPTNIIRNDENEVNKIKENFSNLLKDRFAELNLIKPFDADTSSIDDNSIHERESDDDDDDLILLNSNK